MSVAFMEIPGFDRYRVTSDGRVQTSWVRGSKRRGDWRDMVPRKDAKGYVGVILCAGPGLPRRYVRVHRLVAEAFIPKHSGQSCVRHLDGNPANNRADNLAWGSYADNELDKRFHGTWFTRFNGKLTERHRQEIRNRARDGERQKALAAEFGVSRPTITRLVNGSTWSKLPC